MNDSRAPHSHLIPSFRSIEEEAEFWDTHDTVDFEDEWELVTDVKFVRGSARRAITIHLDEPTTEALAEKAHRNNESAANLAERSIAEHLQSSVG